MGQYNNNDNYNGSVLFCSLASVGVCRLSSSSVVVCNAAGGQAGRPPGALAVGRPTRHGGPVQLRPVSATPVRLVMFLQRQSGERMQYMLDWLIQRLIKQLNQRSSKCLIWSNWTDSSIALNRGHGSTVGPATVSISRLINRLVQPSALYTCNSFDHSRQAHTFESVSVWFTLLSLRGRHVFLVDYPQRRHSRA